jgi:Protein of unknown function (DUF3570)
MKRSKTAGMKMKSKSRSSNILAAALLLPGIMPAHAQTPPEQGQVSVRYLYYKDAQPGLDRIKVSSPSVYLQVPVAGEWSFEGSLVSDSVSGATPRYYSSVSGATKPTADNPKGGMKDLRRAGDVKVTRYFARTLLSAGAAYSKEDDYKSGALSAGMRWSTDDNNTSLDVAGSVTRDTINATDRPNIVDRKKRVNELLVGVTQVLSPQDIVQANLTVSRGKGYYDDPYKFADLRPDKRNATILLARWNRHFSGPDGTLRSSYRYYNDSFGVKSHTVGGEWVQPLGDGWSVTQGVRLYSQTSANFYFDPAIDPATGESVPPQFVQFGKDLFSADQRLSSFGAVTIGLKVAVDLDKLWTLDAKLERYEQRSNWRVGGTGSPGIAPFTANFVQVGASRKF